MFKVSLLAFNQSEINFISEFIDFISLESDFISLESIIREYYFINIVSIVYHIPTKLLYLTKILCFAYEDFSNK